MHAPLRPAARSSRGAFAVGTAGATERFASGPAGAGEPVQPAIRAVDMNVRDRKVQIGIEDQVSTT